jgi:release factor glutamine methyltransferase
MRTSSDAEAPWTIQRLLEWTAPFLARRGVESARLCAEQLLAHVLGIARIKLYTDYQREVGERELGVYRDLVRRAAEQEPVAYLTGRAHFFNLEFEVTPEVLIPRPDTETLVENVIQLARHQSGLASPRVIDLCTGSGCIAAAIAQNIKTASVLAIDNSPAAAAVARRNIERLELAERVSVEVGDLFEPLSRRVDRQPFDLIVANPPYIPTAQIASLDRSVREYEPMSALDGGPDGLALHRRILAESPDRLNAGGFVFLEIAFDQGPAALAIAGEYPGFVEVKILKDNGGRDRVLKARKKS